MVRNRVAFRLQIIGNRPAEVRVDDVMGRPGRRWPVAARQLVRALRPCFHMFQAMGDGVVDRLIIAQLEMEEGHVLRAAPIAAVERVRRSEEHTSELQSLMRISYAVFCLKKKKNNI